MKTNSTPGQPQTARLNPLLLAAVAFALGIVITGLWFQRHHSGSAGGELSDATKNLLGQLPLPVTIRYYSLLPAGSADESLNAFAGRVAQLLEAVQSAGGGKIEITTVNTPAENNANAASADGLQAFNLDKGDACFLGLTIASGKNKEALARLDPQWESALPADLVRVILRVAAVAAPAPIAPEVAKPSAEITSAIHSLIPDVNAVTTQQGVQLLNDEFLKQCGEVGAETEAAVNAAQQKVVAAQNGGSAEELAAAQKNLAQAQVAQGQKYRELAAQLQTQIAVFQQMKAATVNGAK